MIKILFICHGNICRSPMAEFVFRDMVRKAGREAEFEIASAATSSEEIWNGVGNPVYPPVKAKMLEHGIDPSGKRARQMSGEDYRKYDLLIGMDNRNIQNILRKCGNDPDGKVHLLMEYAGKPGREVADPWYTRDFEATWNDVYEGCKGLLEVL